MLLVILEVFLELRTWRSASMHTAFDWPFLAKILRVLQNQDFYPPAPQGVLQDLHFPEKHLPNR